MPRMENSTPGPSGSRGPALRSRLVPSAAAVVAPLIFRCEYPGCAREFDTKTGRGLHARRTHPDWFDVQQNVESSRARWSEEEMMLMAKREAELTLQGEKFINQALLDVLPGRTLEGIKGKRRQVAYRRLVEDLLNEPAQEEPVGDALGGEKIDYRSEIIAFLQSLPRPDTENFSADHLVRICKPLSFSDPSRILAELSLYLQNVFPPKTRKKMSQSVVPT